MFIKTIPTENELKFYYTVHTSLDVVEEKISSLGKNSSDLRELYLGLLYPTEDYKVYPLDHLQISTHSKNKEWVLLTFNIDVSIARAVIFSSTKQEINSLLVSFLLMMESKMCRFQSIEIIHYV